VDGFRPMMQAFGPYCDYLSGPRFGALR